MDRDEKRAGLCLHPFLFPGRCGGACQRPEPLPTTCLEPARRLMSQLQGLSHPSSPLARPPLISGVLIASRMGGEGASLESEDWSLQPPLVMMESSLPLASSSLLSCLVSPFIVSCRRARIGRVAGKQGHKGAAHPKPPTSGSTSSGQGRPLDIFSG